jgi:hypothetical protein
MRLTRHEYAAPPLNTPDAPLPPPESSRTVTANFYVHGQARACTCMRMHLCTACALPVHWHAHPMRTPCAPHAHPTRTSHLRTYYGCAYQARTSA